MTLPLSGVIAVEDESLSQAGPNTPIYGPICMKAPKTNTQPVYVGNDGQGGLDKNTNAFVLEPGASVNLDYLTNLNTLVFAADVSGECITWICLNI